MSEDAADPGFTRILEFLRQARGFDFTGYKPATLERRLRRRMQGVGIDTFDGYLDYLQVHPDEFASLFNTILINVSSFFRDPNMWASIRAHVIPELVADPSSPIRVWSAGCSSGLEVYSVAMLLAEAIGVDACRDRVKLYATDVDEEALTDARRAIYTAKQVSDIPSGLLEKYFEPNGDGSQALHRDLRRCAIFGRHDLLQDAPISRVNLLFCRNTLMYFNADAQGQIMSRFEFSLAPGGFLVLGRAEMLFSHISRFQAVDLKQRIFRMMHKPQRRGQSLSVGLPARENAVGPYPDDLKLRDLAFDSILDPQIVLDAGGRLSAANAAARRRFRLSAADVGTLLQDLELSYRPAELRLSVDRARDERRDVRLQNVSWETAGEVQTVDISIAPLFDDDSAPLGTRITFIDVTPMKALRDELARSKEDLDTAYRGTAVHQRRARDHERGAPVHGRGARDDQRRAPVHERRARDDERGAAVHERRAAHDERRAATRRHGAVGGQRVPRLGSDGSAYRR